MITLTPTEDYELIYKLACDPELYDRIAEFGARSEDLIVDPECLYLLIENEKGLTCGFIVIDQLNATTLRVHCNCLERFRGDYSKQIGKEIIAWFVTETADNFQKLNAEICEIYKDVVKFTMGFGFQVEGINRKAINKHGELYDLLNLGVTRDEARKRLSQK